MSWAAGETIAFRQVWRGNPWLAIPIVVISDEPGLLVTYLPEQAPIGFTEGD